ncbi:ATP-grasp domain-containing protein [Oenococcus sp. UCMA 17063]|nr:ATP-grasp domain-containing protein [Oenococcus sp. UCMA 17063]
MNIIIIGGLGYDYIKPEKWLPRHVDNHYYFVVKAHHFDEFQRHLSERTDIELVKINDWYNSNQIEQFIFDFSQTRKIDRLVSLREEEVIRISQAREFLNISGLRPSSAVLFRDKHEMKKLMRKNGIKVAEDSKVDSFFEALNFIAKTHSKYPYILKPIDGASSRDTFVIKNLSSLEQLDYKYFERAIMETFVPGDVYHIDALYTQGQLRYMSAAKYIHIPIAFQRGKSTASMFLQSDSEESQEMLSFGKKVCMLMPLPENCIIHLETFKNKKGIYFNEIAVRFGGGKILDTIDREFDFNLLGEYLKAESGVPFEHKGILKWEKPRGFLLVTPQKGELSYMPEKVPGDDIDLYEVYAKVGNQYNMGQNSVQALASVEVHADDNESLQRRILGLEEWFLKSVKYKNNL